MSYILRMERNKKYRYPKDSLVVPSTGRVTVLRRCGKRGGRPQKALRIKDLSTCCRWDKTR